MENSFDLFGSKLETTEIAVSKNETINDISVVCEAIQIIRLVKTVMTTRRDVIDTIKVDGAKMTYERALRIAKMKAEKVGNCMVVEKLERVIVSY
jgi:hypothetical protein